MEAQVVLAGLAAMAEGREIQADLEEAASDGQEALEEDLETQEVMGLVELLLLLLLPLRRTAWGQDRQQTTRIAMWVSMRCWPNSSIRTCRA